MSWFRKKTKEEKTKDLASYYINSIMIECNSLSQCGDVLTLMKEKLIQTASDIHDDAEGAVNKLV